MAQEASSRSLALGGAGPPLAMETICDVRGALIDGYTWPLDTQQVLTASEALATNQHLLDGVQPVLRHAGSDHHAVRALFAAQDKHSPPDCDVHAVLCVLLGRYSSGQRRAGANASDGLTSMESLAYMLGLGDHAPGAPRPR